VTPDQFLFHEAQLLDTQRFEEWLALFTEDATYWVPLERNQKDPHQTSSLIYDDRTLLELRVKQFRHSRAHARAPLARTVHQVGNIVVRDLVVTSTLTVVEFRNERQKLWAGLVEHQLRRERDSWLIARKRIDLVNSEGEIEGISILL
jgi:3-phenylpropionate/cinnamic acid dioxygenase small subunit